MYCLLRSVGLACLVWMMVVAVGMTDDKTTNDSDDQKAAETSKGADDMDDADDSKHAKTTKETKIAEDSWETRDIIDTLVAAEIFNRFASALAAADLVETLKGEEPFTVFIPSDEAFEKIPKDVLAELMMPEHKDRLVEILTYHIVPGTLMAGELADKSKLKTVEGSEIKVKSTDGNIFVDEAIVTEADIECENGVIHVIDTLIIPDD